jgi:crossover junction endodeoxyribonuclease RusA
MEPGGPLTIELSWPAKELSPNARVHHMALHRFKKAAKTEAHWATRIARPMAWGHDGPFGVHIIAYPPDNRARDADNLIASLKAHLDGIAGSLEVNDRLFEAPTLQWAEPAKRARIEITLTPRDGA